MNLSTFQIVLIVFGSIIVADTLRLLVLKVMSKKFRIFAFVPDTDNARLEFIAKKLGVETTDIVNQDGVYFNINDVDTQYEIVCVPDYKVTVVGGDVVSDVIETEPVVEPVSEQPKEETVSEDETQK